MINCEALLKKWCGEQRFAFNIILEHSCHVAHKALLIAKRYKEQQVDTVFVQEAALLHDIGVLQTHAPEIGCNGAHPYVCHGYLGRKILEQEGLQKHALACERHIGVGLTREDIQSLNLSLPERDMLPISIEEQIICFADNFFSKTPGMLCKEKSLDDIQKGLKKFGLSKIQRFEQWVDQFGP